MKLNKKLMQNARDNKEVAKEIFEIKKNVDIDREEVVHLLKYSGNVNLCRNLTSLIAGGGSLLTSTLLYFSMNQSNNSSPLMLAIPLVLTGAGYSLGYLTGYCLDRAITKGNRRDIEERKIEAEANKVTRAIEANRRGLEEIYRQC